MSLIATINGKERVFIVKTYALQHTLNKLEASITDIAYILQYKYLDFIIWTMYYSAEYPLYKEDKPVDFTEKDIYDWIDELGGFNGKFMSDFNRAALLNLGVNPDAKESEKKEGEPIKKKAEKKLISQ